MYDAKTGLLGSTIFALSLSQIFYAQQARMYAIMVFLTIVGFYWFIDLTGVKGRNTRWARAGYILSSVLLVYTHVYGLFVMLSQGIIALILLPRDLPHRGMDGKGWMKTGTVIAVMGGPWLLLMLSRVFGAGGPPMIGWIDPPTVGVLVEAVTGMFVPPRSSIPVVAPIMVLLATILGALIIGRSNEKSVSLSNRSMLLLVWAGTVLLAPFFLSNLIAPFLRPRYTIAAAPAMYLLLSRHILNVKMPRARVFVIGLVCGASPPTTSILR